MLFIGLLVLSLCQTFESSGQGYEKLLRGQKTTFDTAVAVQIQQYRLIRKKATIADKYISSLKTTIDSLNETVKLYSALDLTMQQIQQTQQEYQAKNDKAFSDLSQSFDKLLRQKIPPKKFYERTGVIAVFSVIVVESIRHLLK